MKLKVGDYIALSKADVGSRKLDLQNRLLLVDARTPVRLIKAGIVDKVGNMTDKGVALCEEIQAKVQKVYGGLPIAQRKRFDEMKAKQSDYPWAYGTYTKKPYVTNGDVFIVGKPEKWMEAIKGSSKLRHDIPTIISRCTSPKDFIEVIPDIWQMDGIDGIEMIWLSSKDGDTRVSVQSGYYDLVTKRYPSIKFMTRRKKSTSVIIGKVLNRGIKDNIVTLLMPYSLSSAWKLPTKYEE